MPDARRSGRRFAPLPPETIRVRLEGEAARDLAGRLAAMPGVSVITGPDEYPGGRLYLVVTFAGEEKPDGPAE